MWGRLRGCPRGVPGGDAHTGRFYSPHISLWSKELAEGDVLAL